MGEYYNDRGCWPGGTGSCEVEVTATNDAVGYAPNEIKGSYVGSVTVAGDSTGCVTVSFSAGVHSQPAPKVIIFTPAVLAEGQTQQGAVDWACYSPDDNIVDSNLPSNCRGGAPAEGYAICAAPAT